MPNARALTILLPGVVSLPLKISVNPRKISVKVAPAGLLS